MESIDYLRAFRRRWGIVAVAVIIGLGAGYGSKFLTKSQPPTLTYTATTVLLGSSDPNVTNLGTLSALTKIGPVPYRAAKILGYRGPLPQLSNEITVTSDQTSGIMSISDTAPTAHRAQLMANTFARSLVDYLQTKGS